MTTDLSVLLTCSVVIGFGIWFGGDEIGKGIQRGLEEIAKAMKEKK